MYGHTVWYNGGISSYAYNGYAVLDAAGYRHRLSHGKYSLLWPLDVRKSVRATIAGQLIGQWLSSSPIVESNGSDICVLAAPLPFPGLFASCNAVRYDNCCA